MKYQLTEKVVFDPESKLIIIDDGITSLNVKSDIYSAAKRLWKENTILNKLRFPFRVLGGDPLGGELSAGAYYFLQNQNGNNWRIRPYEGDHELTISGNLYAEDPDLPIFIPTVGDYTVQIRLETSSLTQVATVSGLAEEDKDDIANKTWLHSKATNIDDSINLLRKIEEGRWKISDDQMIIYDTDGETPLKVFELFDKEGKPSDKNVYERRPI